MDESIFGDLDEMALPELPDSVWMRLLANALDPDAPAVGLDLIPTDLGPDDSITDDDISLYGEDLTDPTDDGSTGDALADNTPSDDDTDDDTDDGGTDVDEFAGGLHGLGDPGHTGPFGAGDPAGGHDPFGAQPWSGSPDDPYGGDPYS